MPHDDREAIRNRWGIERAQYYVQWGKKIFLFLQAQNTYDKWNAVRLTADTKEDVNKLHAKIKGCATSIIFLSPEDHLLVSKRESPVKNRRSAKKRYWTSIYYNRQWKFGGLVLFWLTRRSTPQFLNNTADDREDESGKKKNHITVGIGILNVLVDTQ